MPELPEVETTIRYLKPAMLRQVIRSFSVSNQGETQLNRGVSEFSSSLIGKELTSLDRIGKWMLFEFQDAKVVGHLRMSGRYKIADNVIDHPHNRFQISLENGQVINYLDQRRFGTFHIADDFQTHSSLKKLSHVRDVEVSCANMVDFTFLLQFL